MSPVANMFPPMVVVPGSKVDATDHEVWTMLLDLRFPGASIVVLAWHAGRVRRALNLCLVTERPVVARIVGAGGRCLVMSTQPSVDAALSAAGVAATAGAGGHPVLHNARGRPR